jgi:2-polyprenyl-6-hydroxyphenyl methylase/3-demethylubiquinone-9 3-methyltransferase
MRTSVDQREVDYYARLAEQWWDEGGKFWPLHRLNGLRSDYLKQRICGHFDRDTSAARPLGGLRIVDIGCGGGILAESMARLGADVLGIDVVEKNIQVARRHARESGLPIEYRQLTAEELAAEGVHYDVVLNMEVVEHVADLPLFLGACNRLLDQRGLQFIATINRNPWSWLIAIVGAEYVLGWLPRGTHRWSRFVRPAELQSMLRDDGLRVDDITGVAINPLTRRFSLSPRVAVNYMLCASHTASR